MSAVFVGQGRSAILVLVTEQLVGTGWLHAGPFQYAGNVGPVDVAEPWGRELHRLGDVLAAAFGLRGVWGVDFVLHAGRPHPVEVNPRYPASLELFDLAFGSTVMHLHAGAFGAAAGPRCAPAWVRQVIGKAVYYAPRPVTFPGSGPWDADLAGEPDPWRVPGFADLPDPGAEVPAGWPVLTLFAAGPTGAEVRRGLQLRAADLDVLFGRGPRHHEGGES